MISKFHSQLVIYKQAFLAFKQFGLTHDLVTSTTLRVKWKKRVSKNIFHVIIPTNSVVYNCSRVVKLTTLKNQKHKLCCKRN